MALALLCFSDFSANAKGDENLPITQSGILRIFEGWDWEKVGNVTYTAECRVSIPATWKNRPVYFMYDAAGLIKCRIKGVVVNDVELDCASPVSEGLGFAPREGENAANADGLIWWREVSDVLRPGEENRICLSSRHRDHNQVTKAWLYSPPLEERVLFLVSPDLESKDKKLVSSYVEHVRQAFNVKAIVKHESFSSPSKLRRYLTKIHREEGISGAVLIGDHPLKIEQEGEDKAVIQYYEALLEDEGRAANFTKHYLELDIWTAWIRCPDDYEKEFTGYLEKINRFYEKKECFPDAFRLVPAAHGGHPGEFTGQRHYDTICQPADFTYFTAHGGIAHRHNGPHNILEIEESLATYPSGLIMKLYGCSSGNIARKEITPVESFLLGRSITQAIVSHTMPQGGAIRRMPKYMLPDLLRICSNLGTMHMFMYDLRCKYPYSEILIGNPFVKVGAGFSAPAGSLQGSISGFDFPASVYVSISRKGDFMGRVKSASNGEFMFPCLPLGEYDVEVHFNAVDSEVHTVQIKSGEATRLRIDGSSLWRVECTVNHESTEQETSWIEVSKTTLDADFTANDLFAIIPDAQGKFSVIGKNRTPIYIRGRLGKEKHSSLKKINPAAGQTIDPIKVKI